MRGPNNPALDSPGPTEASPALRQHPQHPKRLIGTDQAAGQGIDQPINRRFKNSPDSDPYDSDSEPDETLLDLEPDDTKDDGEIVDSAQPNDEVGVTEDMSTLAIHPAHLQSGVVEPLAQASADLAGLHLNGDFAQMEDAAIMLELKAGNMAGFDFLIQKYRKPIINFMYRMTRNQAVAEELAQEVFLRVYRSRETYRAEARFSTWLYRIATNLGVNQARDTRHERTASTVYLDEPDSETGTTPDVADSTPDVESRLLRDERMAAIREHVLALPERQKMAVLMHKYEGMDYSQIGDVLKLSESATKSLLFRAYQTLREKLKGFV